jgi:hypothetical protein
MAWLATYFFRAVESQQFEQSRVKARRHLSIIDSPAPRPIDLGSRTTANKQSAETLDT